MKCPFYNDLSKIAIRFFPRYFITYWILELNNKILKFLKLNLYEYLQIIEKVTYLEYVKFTSSEEECLEY